MSVLRFLSAKKNILIYSIALALLMLLLKWIEYRFLIIDHAAWLYLGTLAVLFLALGIWLAVKLATPKTETIIIEKTVLVQPELPKPFLFDQVAADHLHISKRELEVLEMMSEGLSNQQIADKLFVSVNTIKTHSSRIFEKLEVSRRVQAIEKARMLKLIP